MQILIHFFVIDESWDSRDVEGMKKERRVKEKRFEDIIYTHVDKTRIYTYTPYF